MQVDDVVWEIINQGHCSYKMKTVDRNFCRNEYNLTGLCSKQSCPLANSNYATVLEKKGVCYLYMKVVERVQRPKDQWEVIRLDKNYEKALEQLDTHLQYWSGFTLHKCKQRLTKLRQMLNRMRKLQLKGYNEYSTVSKKVERREATREQKSLIAADLEGSIKSELLDRLKKGTYGAIYNLKPKIFKEVIEDKEAQYLEQQEEEEEEEEIEDISDLNSEEMEDYVVDFESGDEDMEEEEEIQEEEQHQQMVQAKAKKGNKAHKAKPTKKKVEVEYEQEPERAQLLH